MKNMFLVGVVPFTTEWWQQTLYGICQGIDAIVYWLGESAYQVFMLVAKTNIFDYNDPNSIGQIVNRIYVILGIVMVFVFGYTILTLIANPDKMSSGGDNSFQGIIKNTVISIIIIALLPTAYNYLYKIQDSILSNNVIGNIILAGSTVPNDNNYNTAATVAMTNIFTAFYHPIDGDGNTVTPSECDRLINVDGDTETIPICEAYLSALYTAQDDANSSEFITNAELRQAITDGYIEYIPLVSTLAGALAAYLFVSFALDLGVRAVKLSVLQVIAPIPVIARISSGGKKIFDSWFKQIKSTYLLVFVRLATIYFAMFTIQLIVDNVDLWPVETGGGASGLLVLVANVIVILGILQFAKDAPKLISDLFGVNGKITWRIKDKLNENEYAKRLSVGAGAAVGGLTSNIYKGIKEGHVMGGIGAGIGGFFRGGAAGIKNGNVSSWRDIGRGIQTARAEAGAKQNEAASRRDAALDAIFDPAGTLKEAGKSVATWITGEGISNAKLESANKAKDTMEYLYKQFEGSYKAIDAAETQMLKDLAQGKTVSFSEDISYQKLNAAGTALETVNIGAGTALDEKQIKEYNEWRRQEKLLTQFSDAKYGKQVKTYGNDVVSKQLTQTLGTLGSEAGERIFEGTGIDSLDGFKELFADDGDISALELAQLRRVTDNVSSEAKRAQVSAGFEDKNKGKGKPQS